MSPGHKGKATAGRASKADVSPQGHSTCFKSSTLFGWGCGTCSFCSRSAAAPGGLCIWSAGWLLGSRISWQQQSSDISGSYFHTSLECPQLSSLSCVSLSFRAPLCSTIQCLLAILCNSGRERAGYFPHFATEHIWVFLVISWWQWISDEKQGFHHRDLALLIPKCCHSRYHPNSPLPAALPAHPLMVACWCNMEHLSSEG